MTDNNDSLSAFDRKFMEERAECEMGIKMCLKEIDRLEAENAKLKESLNLCEDDFVCQMKDKDIEIVAKDIKIRELEDECDKQTMTLILAQSRMGAIGTEMKEFYEPKIKELEAKLVAVIDILKHAETFQPNAIRIIRERGFIFDGVGDDRTKEEWEKLTFSFYSDLCDLHSRIQQLKIDYPSLFKEDNPND